jgi:histidine triad (HIT) family protein
MNRNCVFCRIVSGDVPATIVYQDPEVTAFRDIEPQAPTHVLVIPNIHLASLNDAEGAEPALLGRLLQVAARVARKAGVDEFGYRVVVNTGPNAGQTVYHTHLHVLGGNRLRMPLG